jgi:hypothetical protein
MADSLHVGFQQGIQANSGILYQTLQVLGVGGNAETVLAIATSGTHRGVPFAIKIFRRISKPERRRSFLKERSIECLTRIQIKETRPRFFLYHGKESSPRRQNKPMRWKGAFYKRKKGYM